MHIRDSYLTIEGGPYNSNMISSSFWSRLTNSENKTLRSQVKILAMKTFSLMSNVKNLSSE